MKQLLVLLIGGIGCLLWSPWTVDAGCVVETPTGYSLGASIRDDKCDKASHKKVISQYGYETVAASQTNQVMGATGAIGDVLAAVVCSFSAASVGLVTIKDGAGSAISLFQAQAAAGYLTSGPLNIVATGAGWSISTGTNTTCIGIGRFS